MIRFTVDLLGFTLLDPMTFVTDILLTIACWLFARRLAYMEITNEMHKNWKYFFAILGLSTLIGGIAHLLFNYTGKSLLLASWFISGFGVYFVELASIEELSNPKFRKLLKIGILVQLVLFAISLSFFRSFVLVKIHSAIGLIAVVSSIQSFFYFKENRRKSALILMGIIIAGISSATHSFHLSISDVWFNYNDTSHIILFFGLYMLFLGSYKIKIVSS